MENIRILTVGIKEIDFDLINPDTIDNEKSFCNKPEALCLYGSTLINGKYGNVYSHWKEFLHNAELSKNYDFGASYELNKNSKILEIDSIEKYLEILDIHNIIDDVGKLCLNFENISKEYDAFHLTRDTFYELRSMYLKINEHVIRNFYSYDAETWIIFNPDCINRDSIKFHNNVKLDYEYESDNNM